MLDITEYLSSKGLPIKPAGPNDIHTSCVFCGEEPEKRGRLYINVDPNKVPPGQFFCHRCGESGALNKIRKHFGDPIIKDDDPTVVHDEVRQKTYEIFQLAGRYYADLLHKEEHADVVQWLHNERGLTDETIVKHQIGWADGTLKLHLMSKGYKPDEIMETGLMSKFGSDFLYGHVTIPYHASGSVVQIRGKQIGGKYVTPPGQKARLFNTDALFGAEDVLVTEGEFDALVLEQQGYAAVGAPGAISWQDSWTDRLSQAKRVYIVFDNDETGRRGSERLATTLGAKARIIKMPEAEPGKPKIDPTEFFVGQQKSKDDFEAMLRMSRGGNLLSVYDAAEEWVEMQGVPGLPLGIAQIDALLQPGLLPGQLLIWLAKTGVGKTILLLNLIYRMQMLHPDFKALFVSLEQTRSEWMERARRIHRFYNPEATDMSVLELFKDHLMMTDKNRMTMEELEDAVDEFSQEQGRKPDVVFVDYLGYFARGYRGEGYERTSAAVMDLKGFAKDHRLVVATPHQVGRGVKFGEEMEADVGRESGVVEETADFLFALWASDMRKGVHDSERTGRITLKITKSRHGGTNNSTQLQFAPHSLAMVPVEEPVLIQRAKDELEFSIDSSDIPPFEQMIYRHANRDNSLRIDPDDYRRWKAKIDQESIFPDEEGML